MATRLITVNDILAGQGRRTIANTAGSGYDLRPPGRPRPPVDARRGRLPAVRVWRSSRSAIAPPAVRQPARRCPLGRRRHWPAGWKLSASRARPHSAVRGYDAEHRRRRAAGLADAYGTMCEWCGKVMLAGEKLELDHVLPLARGLPADGPVRFLHARCNRQRAGRMPEARTPASLRRPRKRRPPNSYDPIWGV